ncbi:Blp family class II bacteriocin [Leuconostoc gasicomitatum]|nr:Blp family class II bacteriocin [Leuconostoc gasicomitatum]
MINLENFTILSNNDLSNVIGGQRGSTYSAGQAYGFMAGALIRGAFLFY